VYRASDRVRLAGEERDRVRGRGGERHTADPAGSLAKACAEVLGASAAVLSIQGGGGEPELLGSVGPVALPLPEPPFMLRDTSDGEPRLWQGEANGRDWLHIETKLAEGRRLVLSACFVGGQGRDAADAAIRLVRFAIAAFAFSLDSQLGFSRRIAGLEAALNQSAMGIVLLGCDGKLLFANRRAETLFERGEGLRRSGDSIGAQDLDDAVKLQVAIEHVCNAGDQCMEDPVVAVRRKAPRRPLLVSVSPAPNGSEAVGDARAILRIVDPDADVRPLIEPVCAHYRLSVVETRLACLLATGATLETAAASLRIKEQTARSYLKQIFMKTDTNRQTDLVRLLLSSTIRALPVGRFRML
jgi:DNA-binding CsgD family transcriptional regulator/PAS domain-containing protein